MKARWLVAALAVIALVAVVLVRQFDGPVEAAPGELAAVVRVVDGDTVWVDRGDVVVKVRVIGLDTPERGDCWFRESTARAAELLGDEVRIAPDPSQDAVDRYGRELHDVWLEDGRLFAEVMVREGQARAYVYDADAPNRYAGQIAAAEAEARDTGAGLWATDTCRGRP